MLNEALAALAAKAGSGLITAMMTDGWQQVRTRVARLLGRGDAREQERQEARLERARRELVAASEEEAEGVRQRHSQGWRARFEDLLDDVPEIEAEFRELVAFLAEQSPAVASGAVRVNAHAHGRARQAVQGQGVQNNIFTNPSSAS